MRLRTGAEMDPAALQESVLIVDEREVDALALRAHLDAPERTVRHVSTLREGLNACEQHEPDLVITSLELPTLRGPRAVRLIKERFPRVRVVAVTADPNTADAVASVRAGAEDYLAKPVDPARLEQAVGRALRELRADRLLRATQSATRDRYGFKHLLSRSPKMMEVFDAIEAVAATDATVLILGETGTGKELVARAIHDGSPRSASAYVSVNCGAFSESLLESELFGHERGSFTGAVERREGVFSMADGGTLFLDELGETSLSVQVNLLRVLEEMSFRRVGGEKLVTVDVRIVAATNTDLDAAVAAGRFREDLYYRLNVFPVRLPPLRERREDIPLLLKHFIDDAAREYRLEPPILSADALAWIQGWHWPGNVRQLRAMAERWVILARGRTLLREMLPEEMTDPARIPVDAGMQGLDPSVALGPQIERWQHMLERDYFVRLLQRFDGHLQQSADHAGITRRTLYTKLKQYGIDAKDYRD